MFSCENKTIFDLIDELILTLPGKDYKTMDTLGTIRYKAEKMKEGVAVVFINNPFEIVILAVKELYPETQAHIQFNPTLRGKKLSEYGCTTFPDDGSPPLIDISTNISLENMTDILAHELSHVIVGIEHEHDQAWENVYSTINKRYTEILAQRFKRMKGEV